MKFSSSIVAAALLRCIHSAEAATPKLRANTIDKADNAAEVVVDAESKHTARERISKYVTEGQMFYILDSQPVLYEDPSKASFPFTNVFWFCQPVVAPDNNGDGMYDSVVSHVNIYMPASTSSQGTAAGASNIDGGSNHGIAKPFFATDGYTASWVKSGKYYDEKVVDFGDFTVTEMKGKEFQMYETSAPGTSGGLVMSGEGTWTFDTSLPLLQELAKAVGTDLTPEACAARYAESWNASHSNSAEAEE